MERRHTYWYVFNYDELANQVTLVPLKVTGTFTSKSGRRGRKKYQTVPEKDGVIEVIRRTDSVVLVSAEPTKKTNQVDEEIWDVLEK